MRAFLLIVAGLTGLGLAVTTWFASSDLEAAVEGAESENRVNQLMTESAPQQQVANGWFTNDLLTVIAEQNTQLVRTQTFLIGVVGLAILAAGMADSRAQKEFPYASSTTAAAAAPRADLKSETDSDEPPPGDALLGMGIGESNVRSESHHIPRVPRKTDQHVARRKKLDPGLSRPSGP